MVKSNQLQYKLWKRNTKNAIAFVWCVDFAGTSLWSMPALRTSKNTMSPQTKHHSYALGFFCTPNPNDRFGWPSLALTSFCQSLRLVMSFLMWDLPAGQRSLLNFKMSLRNTVPDFYIIIIYIYNIYVYDLWQWLKLGFCLWSIFPTHQHLLIFKKQESSSYLDAGRFQPTLFSTFFHC